MPSPAAALCPPEAGQGRRAQPERRLVSSGVPVPPSAPPGSSPAHSDALTHTHEKYTERHSKCKQCLSPGVVQRPRGPPRHLNRYKTASGMCRYCQPVSHAQEMAPRLPLGDAAAVQSVRLSVCLSVCPCVRPCVRHCLQSRAGKRPSTSVHSAPSGSGPNYVRACRSIEAKLLWNLKWRLS